MQSAWAAPQLCKWLFSSDIWLFSSVKWGCLYIHYISWLCITRKFPRRDCPEVGSQQGADNFTRVTFPKVFIFLVWWGFSGLNISWIGGVNTNPSTYIQNVVVIVKTTSTMAVIRDCQLDDHWFLSDLDFPREIYMMMNILQATGFPWLAEPHPYIQKERGKPVYLKLAPALGINPRVINYRITCFAINSPNSVNLWKRQSCLSSCLKGTGEITRVKTGCRSVSSEKSLAPFARAWPPGICRIFLCL